MPNGSAIRLFRKLVQSAGRAAAEATESARIMTAISNKLQVSPNPALQMLWKGGSNYSGQLGAVAHEAEGTLRVARESYIVTLMNEALNRPAVQNNLRFQQDVAFRRDYQTQVSKLAEDYIDLVALQARAEGAATARTKYGTNLRLSPPTAVAEEMRKINNVKSNFDMRIEEFEATTVNRAMSDQTGIQLIPNRIASNLSKLDDQVRFQFAQPTHEIGKTIENALMELSDDINAWSGMSAADISDAFRTGSVLVNPNMSMNLGISSGLERAGIASKSAARLGLAITPGTSAATDQNVKMALDNLNKRIVYFADTQQPAYKIVTSKAFKEAELIDPSSLSGELAGALERLMDTTLVNAQIGNLAQRVRESSTFKNALNAVKASGPSAAKPPTLSEAEAARKKLMGGRK